VHFLLLVHQASCCQSSTVSESNYWNAQFYCPVSSIAKDRYDFLLNNTNKDQKYPFWVIRLIKY
ncbi:MAG: hypothetical protein ACC657_06780, partial [Thiohalomonadales bacterium]